MVRNAHIDIRHDSNIVLFGDSVGYASIELIEQFCVAARRHGVDPAKHKVLIGSSGIKVRVEAIAAADIPVPATNVEPSWHTPPTGGGVQ